MAQFSSVAQSCPTFCDPMDCSTSGFTVHHQHPEFAQTHVHRVGDAIQPSHPLSSHFPPAFNLSQHYHLFKRVSSSYQAAKVGKATYSTIHVWRIPWTAACQASLSFTISWSFLKLMSIELVMPSNHLILCHALLLPPSIFPSIRVFSYESSGGQSTGVSASTSVFPMNIHD